MKHLRNIFISLACVGFLSACQGKTPSDEPEIIKHTVTFYDDQNVYFTETVVDGELATKPDDPSRIGYTFKYWCNDDSLKNPYDFSTPVKADLSLYSLFEKLDPFYDYSSEYLATNAPFTCEQLITENDEDIQIVLITDGIEMNPVINKDQIRLAGAFENLKVSNVTIDGRNIIISTTGKVKKDIGYVIFSKFTNSELVYLTVPIDVNDLKIPLVEIDKTSFIIDERNKDILFSVKMENQSLKNEDNLSPEQYLEKVSDGTYNFFSLTEGYNVDLTILSINPSFSGFEAKLHFDGDFDVVLIDIISNYVRLNIAKEAFEVEQQAVLGFELNILQSSSLIRVSQLDEDTYIGSYKIHLVGCRFSNELKSNVSKLLSTPYNENLFINIPDATVRIMSMSFNNDFEIFGKLEIHSEETIDNANVALNTIVIDEVSINPVSKLFEDTHVTPRGEVVKVKNGFDNTINGTIYQDEGTSYGGIKNVIQNIALHEEEQLTAIDQIIFMGTTIGKISYGIGSGDYMLAADAVGKVLDMDAIRNPALVALERLDAIMNELKEIERRIDALGEKIDDLKRELEEIGQLSYLDNFLNAYSLWNDFISGYYTPMVNQVDNFSTSYYRYYYDFVMASSSLNDEEVAKIDLYYDIDGSLVFPADNLTYSVDGKIIDKSKTKTIVFNELHHALAGIRHNQGHSYTSIENDIIADLVSYRQYEKEELAEIVKVLTFNAMKSYFSSQEKIDSFVNTFKNFCNALTASDMPSSLSITPLNSFKIMLETIYNFGFEIEPDLNLVAINLSISFYGAKKIIDFVRAINSGDINISKYDELVTNVSNELSSRRFYHSNDENGNVYCFASSCYVKYSCDAYGIACSLSESAIVVRAEDGKDLNRASKLENFSSIDELTYDLIRVKLRIYNKIKATNYSLKDYFVHLGMISPLKADLLKGIIMSINGVVTDEDYTLLTYQQEKLTFYNGTEYRKDYSDYEYYLNFNSYAISGKSTTFDGQTSYTGLSAFVYVVTSLGEIHFLFNGELIDEVGLQGSYDYYFNLAPVESNTI